MSVSFSSYKNIGITVQSSTLSVAPKPRRKESEKLAAKGPAVHSRRPGLQSQISIHLPEEIYLSIFHFIIRMQSIARTRRAEPERLAHQQEHVGARWRLVWIGWQAIASGWFV